MEAKVEARGNRSSVPPSSAPNSEPVLREGKLGHGFPTDEMLLNDALQRGRRAGVIPGALGIHDGDGAARADLEAVGLGAIDQCLRPDEAEFLQPALQIFPRLDARLARAALGFGLVGAEEDVAAEFLHTQFGDADKSGSIAQILSTFQDTQYSKM